MLEDKNGNSVMARVSAKGIQRTQASIEEVKEDPEPHDFFTSGA